jgi:RNA polymerase sigma factor (sigma-70 family)
LRRESRRPTGARANAKTTELADDVVGALDLEAALSRLAPRQRAAVVLRYLADLTVPEVAKAMGCADGTVKSTLHSALERLRVEFSQECEP